METNNADVKYKAEGFIFPSTYQFNDSMTEKDMLAMMVKEFNTQINHEKIGEAAEKTKMSIHDIVTIASMVELEAVFKEEQPRIAGVFLRRLKIYMPIQSDTTIQYILGGEQKAEITIADTRIEIRTTRMLTSGLPPGPVGSPGMDAIKAVLNPENYGLFILCGRKRRAPPFYAHLRRTFTGDRRYSRPAVRKEHDKTNC